MHLELIIYNTIDKVQLMLMKYGSLPIYLEKKEIQVPDW